MSQSSNDRAIRRAMERLSKDPRFLAWVFSHAQRVEGVGDEDLARRLGVPAARWVELSLCPRPLEGRFAQNLADLVQEFGLDGERLTSLIRKIDVLCGERPETSGGDARGSLLAARSRPKPPPDGTAASDAGGES